PRERPGLVAPTIALAAVGADHAVGTPREDEADPRHTRDRVRQLGLSRVDLVDRQWLIRVDEVHERVRPRRDHADTPALERFGSAVDPGAEVLVEIVDEPLEQTAPA